MVSIKDCVNKRIMMADGFTKPVDKTKFLKCRDYILTKAQAV